ncbi:MAG: hypothetical protein HON53_14095 [Planctomycetaceae bacterium]|nr:hypothetical protein [Planctomycetaceae bacterium]
MADQQLPSGQERQYVGVHMKCCNVYVRAYVNHDNSAFVGWCARCAKQTRIPIVAEGGSTGRFFGAS